MEARVSNIFRSRWN